MNRDVHKISIRIRHSRLGKGCSVGPFFDFLLRSVLSYAIQSLLHVVNLYAEMIEAGGALVLGVDQHAMVEVCARQLNSSPPWMPRMASPMQVFEPKHVDVKIRQLFRLP